jgi:hypothetical protein
MSFPAELKRRNVIRMAGLHLDGAWLVVQVASTVFPAYEFPSWALRAVILVRAIGLIPALYRGYLLSVRFGTIFATIRVLLSWLNALKHPKWIRGAQL